MCFIYVPPALNLSYIDYMLIEPTTEQSLVWWLQEVPVLALHFHESFRKNVEKAIIMSLEPLLWDILNSPSMVSSEVLFYS